MIIQPELIKEDEISADVCIIGTGIAGLSVAKEFIGSGKSVIILESGGLEPGLTSSDLTSGENVGLPYYELHDSRARAFGGSSHFWHFVPGLRLRGMDAVDFEKKDWVPYSGWPITKSDLDPYYERAHEFLKIGPYNYASEYWIEPSELNYLKNDEADIFRTTMFQFARKDILYNDYHEEFKQAKNVRILLNTTVLGIRTTENSSLVTHLEVTTPKGYNFTVKSIHYILAAGGLENPRLLLLSNDNAKNGLGNNKGLVGRFFMEHPHIWGKGKVGIYYPSEREKFNPNRIYHYHYRRGIPLLGYLIFNENVIRENNLLNITFGVRGESIEYPAGYLEGLAAIRSAMSNIKHGRIDKKMFKGLWLISNKGTVILYELMRKVFNGKTKDWKRYGLEETGISINLMAEQAPNPDSKVFLGDELDLFGQRKIKLDWQLTDLDLYSMNKALQLLNTSIKDKGLGHIDINLSADINEMADKIKGGYHHMGTTRMHNDPSLGVVDENCKLHGTENLFVAGSSVFPTSGYANPTLTIAALSLRLADHLKKLTI